MAQGSTQPLTEMSTRKIPGGVKASLSRLSKENVGASTSHTPMGLHGLITGIALLYFTFLLLLLLLYASIYTVFFM
jgi:hypothetical protein